MDLRVYFQKVRKIEAEIPEAFAVMVSRDTPDGGRRGVRTDVARSVAARLIAEEKADLASPEETAQFRAETQAKCRVAQEVTNPLPKPGKKA